MPINRINRLAICLLALGLGKPLLAQCSNGTITFVSFSPIRYNLLARMGAMEWDVQAALAVNPSGDSGGPVTVTDLKVKLIRNGVSTEAEATPVPQPLVDQRTISIEAVLDAVAQWRVINETGSPISLPLVVEFRLSGVSSTPYDEKNRVILTEDRLLVRVLGKRYARPQY